MTALAVIISGYIWGFPGGSAEKVCHHCRRKLRLILEDLLEEGVAILSIVLIENPMDRRLAGYSPQGEPDTTQATNGSHRWHLWGGSHRL